MTTTIPPTVFARITQTKSYPEIIVASLNEAERMYSGLRKKPHGNAKRVYPFWKTCQVCSQPFPTTNRCQAIRNKTCSCECANKLVGKYERKHPMPNVECAVCGKPFYRPPCRLRGIAVPTCSRRCNGKERAKTLVLHSHKGRSGWTAESLASYRLKMSGAHNPAWKGGVTYFRKHGNYAVVKYVRCPTEYAGMARKDGYVMEHRLFVAQALGRLLPRSEIVHHADHDPTNNALHNLMLFASNRAHKLFEHHGSPLPLWQG